MGLSVNEINFQQLSDKTSFYRERNIIIACLVENEEELMTREHTPEIPSVILGWSEASLILRASQTIM